VIKALEGAHPCRDLCDRVGILTCWPDRRDDSGSLSLSFSPLRFDLYWTLNARCVVIEAAPVPILRAFDQSSMHRVAMDVAQLLDTLGFAPDVEIVVAWFPEGGTLDRP
jgi:hypothetical protein